MVRMAGFQPSSPIDRILARLRSGPPGVRLLLFDFDGTLVGFALAPEAVHLPDARRALLRRIAVRPDVVLGFVSGRRLDDLRGRVAVEPAWYAGLHGMELDLGDDAPRRHPALDVFAGVANSLAAHLESRIIWPGVHVENKGGSVVLHWRGAHPDDAREARAMLADEVERFSDAVPVRLLRGDAVWEVLPDADVDKGHAVQAMRQRLAETTGGVPRTMFVGDDWTDEHGFAALGEDGVSVCVGTRESDAHFRLATPGDVELLLTALAESPPFA